MRYRIAMIDDDPDDQVFYRRLFEELNNSVIFEAYSSVEEFLSEHSSGVKSPALILLDLNMPRVSGLDFIRSCNGSGDFNGCPILVLTTSSSPLDMSDCKNEGVHSYFIKPLSYEECKELVSSIYNYWFNFNSLSFCEKGAQDAKQ